MGMPKGSVAPNRVDLSGQRVGKWLVTGRTDTRGKLIFWECQCDCGTVEWRRPQVIKLGAESCGCAPRRRVVTHGMSRTPTYQSWLGMKARCADERNADYGARGIKVCARWVSFENFLADMGEAPPGTSIERIENDKGYEPGNCKWAGRVEQNQNRRCAVPITAHGMTLNLAEWSRRTGVRYSTLYKRLVIQKWLPETAIPKPGPEVIG